jgi:hypothetical protein
MKTQHPREYPTREAKKDRTVDRAAKKQQKREEERVYEIEPLQPRDCIYAHSDNVACPACLGFED